MPSPRAPEQAYDVRRGVHTVRPGRPAAYVPPVLTPPYGQQYGTEIRRDRPDFNASRTSFQAGARYERNPYDTYRPAYEATAPTRTPPGNGSHAPVAGAGPRPPGPGPGPSSVRVPGPAPEKPVVRPEGGRAAVRRAERARKAAQRPEMLRKLVPQALVVAFLAGGTSAFVANDKEVELNVDGTTHTLHTFADDVGELLDEQGLKLGEHDSVGPTRQQAVSQGDEIDVRYGRPVDLTLDGSRHRVWTTARTVEGALRQFGVRAEGARISVARSADIPRTGIKLDVRTERSVTFLADGHEQTVRTNATTVLEALSDAGIELAGLDTTSVPMESFPRDGQTVTVMRITGKEKVQEERIAFETVRQEDPGLSRGTEIVARAGKTGIRRVTYRLRTVNGVREKPRRIAVEVLRHPQKQIIRVGTRPLPSSVPGADHLDWPSLAQCESGGRPGAVDGAGSHGGLYQFDSYTWRDLGGSGRPQDAPPDEQTYRAKKLYISQGASPWPYCGPRLSK